jgi:hypothetical protein
MSLLVWSWSVRIIMSWATRGNENERPFPLCLGKRRDNVESHSLGLTWRCFGVCEGLSSGDGWERPGTATNELEFDTRHHS